MKEYPKNMGRTTAGGNPSVIRYHNRYWLTNWMINRKTSLIPTIFTNDLMTFINIKISNNTPNTGDNRNKPIPKRKDTTVNTVYSLKESIPLANSFSFRLSGSVRSVFKSIISLMKYTERYPKKNRKNFNMMFSDRGCFIEITSRYTNNKRRILRDNTGMKKSDMKTRTLSNPSHEV